MRITDAEWEAQYAPKYDKHGDLVRLCWNRPGDARRIKKAHDEQRLWTQLDCDGHWVVVSGKAYVNRVDYLVTSKPYALTEDVEVYDPDEQVCADCGEVYYDEHECDADD